MKKMKKSKDLENGIERVDFDRIGAWVAVVEQSESDVWFELI